MDPAILSIAGIVVGVLSLFGLAFLSVVVIGWMIAQSAKNPDRRAWGALRTAVKEQELLDLADSKLRSAGRSMDYEFTNE